MHQRQTHIDALKFFASQVIVLHHFAAYGPLSEALNQAAPRLADWLYDYGRMAVQVFLVLGGYLAVRSLAPSGQAQMSLPWRAVAHRYARLILPFLVALLLAVASSLVARQWLDHEFIPEAPTWGQALAHALLLHDVLGADALSAGVWYVAIDFQLFVVLAGLLWLGRRRRGAQVAVLALTLASLFYFNRDAALDDWAVYFFGAYGLGALAFWAGQSSRGRPWWGGLLALVGVGALVIEFRERIALALAVALLLAFVQQQRGESPRLPALPSRWARGVHRLGQASYALFLVHFPVLMLGNALFAQWAPAGAWAAWAGLLGSWAVSLGLALVFERWVEKPLSTLGKRPATPLVDATRARG